MAHAARITVDGDAGDRIVATPHGAQLLSWVAGGRERLYLSPAADFAPGRAIRGGVPLIFPQFNAWGPGTRHGFARLREWTRVSTTDGEALRLQLHDDEATRADWPHAFVATLSARLSPGELAVSLTVENPADTLCTFTAALHTYLRVDDVHACTLHGFEGRAFLDATDGNRPGTQDATPLRFPGEFDRIWPGAGDAVLRLHDGDAGLECASDGFPDTVVWTPGETLAATLADVGAAEASRFLCIEPAAILSPVTLAPGGSWTGTQRLRVVAAP